MKSKLSQKLAFVMLAIFATGCTMKKEPDNPSAEQAVGKLSALGAYYMPYDRSVSMMRANMVRDAALAVGARSGLAFRSKQINGTTIKYDTGLTQVFNFNGLVLDDNVLPPVLVESDNNLHLANDVTIRVSDRNFEIIRQAKFVTAAPTWQDYLMLRYNPPEDPDPSIMPKSPGERAIWRQYIQKGWSAGIKQAESIFKENLARLKRDFSGMVRYHSLLSQNMVTPPYVGTIEMGITGDSKQVNVNDRILRITALPELKSDSGAWRTVVIRNDRK
ncbi:MAG: type IV secretory system conjugative DNA transfer family protein [Francisellaceae bacterium]|jgi:defect in organelle trafficking protein DotC|nr:type IV secretory system conjugative DNA transfer family protein [Francisellaceae bacterium]